MPEMLTKHPDVALRILKDAKVTCGINARPPTILTTCPRENYCSVPTGEICIYGISDIPKMTQIHGFDIFLIPDMLLPLFAFIILIFALGFMVGIKTR